ACRASQRQCAFPVVGGTGSSYPVKRVVLNAHRNRCRYREPRQRPPSRLPRREEYSGTSGSPFLGQQLTKTPERARSSGIRVRGGKDSALCCGTIQGGFVPMNKEVEVA